MNHKVQKSTKKYKKDTQSNKVLYKKKYHNVPKILKRTKKCQNVPKSTKEYQNIRKSLYTYPVYRTHLCQCSQNVARNEGDAVKKVSQRVSPL